jgi:tetratricopeptide (TPR) repeat protein
LLFVNAIPAVAAPYVVEGFALGERAVGNQNYSAYACRPSDRYAGVTQCQRTQKRGAANFTGTILHAQDGVALYLMASVAPVSLNRSAIEQEIATLTREFGERPSELIWFDPRQGLPTSVIAAWGQIKLDELKFLENAAVTAGGDPRTGVLVDSLANPTRSAKAALSVYRVLGGPGYVYSASFDSSGRGHRQYVAINAVPLAVRQYELDLKAILQKDQARPSGDVGLWPDVAKLTRALARDTSAKTAGDAMDRVFEGVPSKKLRSHVWPLLPGGAIEHMEMHQYGTIDIYGTDTEYPQIRRDIQDFLADKANAKEPFVEFLYYVIGEYDKALQANSNSVISDVFHYASGYQILTSLVEDAMAIVKPRTKPDDFLPTLVDGRLRFLNANPGLYDNKLLAAVVPNFAARAAQAKAHFEAVMRDPAARHADDAAYMLAWLAFHQDQPKQALAYLSQAMMIGNAEEDYKRPAAMKQAVRILERYYPPREQVAIVAGDRAFVGQPALWYVAARSAYREFDYALAIETAERALKTMNIPLERLPATTDPKRIEPALERINPKLLDDLNIGEIPYLIEAAREFQAYETYLKTVANQRPDDVFKKVRAITIKYSMLLDLPQQPAARRRQLPELAHKDLRQALHLIELSLAGVPQAAPHAKLREWLHYRKARILAVHAPKSVAAAVAAMRQELPSSQLLDDALAERLYAEGVMLRDLNAAQQTFRQIVDAYPRGNALDNAYTWMAIIYRCEGRTDDAQNLNREIIRRFPLTRHAGYARERMATPDGCGL